MEYLPHFCIGDNVFSVEFDPIPWPFGHVKESAVSPAQPVWMYYQLHIKGRPSTGVTRAFKEMFTEQHEWILQTIVKEFIEKARASEQTSLTVLDYLGATLPNPDGQKYIRYDVVVYQIGQPSRMELSSLRKAGHIRRTIQIPKLNVAARNTSPGNPPASTPVPAMLSASTRPFKLGEIRGANEIAWLHRVTDSCVTQKGVLHFEVLGGTSSTPSGSAIPVRENPDLKEDALRAAVEKRFEELRNTYFPGSKKEEIVWRMHMLRQTLRDVVCFRMALVVGPPALVNSFRDAELVKRVEIHQ